MTVDHMAHPIRLSEEQRLHIAARVRERFVNRRPFAPIINLLNIDHCSEEFSILIEETNREYASLFTQHSF